MQGRSEAGGPLPWPPRHPLSITLLKSLAGVKLCVALVGPMVRQPSLIFGRSVFFRGLNPIDLPYLMLRCLTKFNVVAI